jgi:hypothetical protein
MSFSRYNTDDQVVSSETVVRGLWSGDTNTFPIPFTTKSGYTEYYLDVYESTNTNIQFDIQFGNLYGSGSNLINPNVTGSSPSRVVYGQYRNLVYGTENTNFSFNNSVTASSIYIVNVARSRYKESLLPGSFELTLTSGSSTITLIDDSTTTNLSRFLGENRYYNIISGSITNGSFSTATNYGFFLPDLGIAILDSGSLSRFIPPITTTLPISSANYNHLKLYSSIVSGSNFKLQSSETVSSTYFFTRVKNSEFNYTTNPSIIDDNGNLLYTTLINSPQTFPTTVGLYNDNNELLAVAKMSRPLTKDFTKEALIRIKIDY